MIDGVEVKKLKVIPDERGKLMEIMRSDDEIFNGFGQVYMTTAMPGVVKGWHFHENQEDNFSVVKGMIKLALYDSRENSPTKGEVNEFFIGEANPIVVHIPKFVYHGFKGISENEAIVVNIITKPYNHEKPDEFRVEPHNNNIPYEWERKDK